MAKQLSAGRVLAVAAAAAVLGTVIMFAVVLPAEFNRDPLGFGRLTGLDRLSAPVSHPPEQEDGGFRFAREYARSFRSDTVDLELAAAGRRGDRLEHKVWMEQDATLIYEWTVPEIANPEDFYSDFHGHTLDEDGNNVLATYRQADGTYAKGALITPFDGEHGWYFENRSANPVVVRVKISGFYRRLPFDDDEK